MSQRILNCIKDDGRLIGITFARAKGSKPHSIRITGKDKQDTLLGITGLDFDTQYRRAITIWAEFRSIELSTTDSMLLFDTRNAFIKHYGIKFKQVTYTVIDI